MLPVGCGALFGLGRHGPSLLLLLLGECITLEVSEWGDGPGESCGLAGECSGSSGSGEGSSRGTAEELDALPTGSWGWTHGRG